jgi:hypothetical protein
MDRQKLTRALKDYGNTRTQRIFDTLISSKQK